MRIKKIAQLIASTCLCFPAAARAGNEGGASISISGIAPSICSFSSAMRARSAQNMLLTSSGQGAANIIIPQMVDDATARLQPAAMELSIQGVCNVPHQVTLRSARRGLALDKQTPDPEGLFLRKVAYRAIAQWGTQTAKLLANADNASPEVTQDVFEPRFGDLTINISIDGSDNDFATPVAAGSYSDILTISIGARP